MIISLFGGPARFNNMDDDERIKKISENEIIDSFLEYLKNNIGLVENVEKDSYAQKIYDSVLREAVLDKSAWENIERDRPAKKEVDEIKKEFKDKGLKLPDESLYSSGTDMEVLTYENNTWADYDKGLRIKVTIEYGNILAIETLIDIEQSFFW